MTLELGKESRRDIYLTIDVLASHEEEPVEVHINDGVFYQPGDLMIPAR